MKIIQTILCLSLFVAFMACSDNDNSPLADMNENEFSSDFRNFYAPWQGTNADNLAFAKQMGYDYIAYMPNMEKHSEAKDMKFYLVSPEYYAYDRRIVTEKTYSEDSKESISQFVALKDASLPFPDNLATGWF